MLAEQTPEVYPESNGGQITLKMLQDAYGQTLLNFPKAQYMYVHRSRLVSLSRLERLCILQ